MSQWKHYQSRYVLETAGGGGNPDVVPAPSPDRQDLAAGTITSMITFSPPTGGSGSGFSYAVALSKPVGSGALIAGGGIGPYTLSVMGGGESYGVTLTATDSGDGQVANNFVVVDVAATVPSSQIDSFYIPNVTIQAEVQAIRFLGGDEFLIPNAQEGVV